MQTQDDSQNFSVIWRGKKSILKMNLDATLKALGDELQKLTHVKADTMRLIVPMNKSSKLLYPYSEEHSFLTLEAASILEGKSIRMLGVPEDEVDEVLRNAKVDLRIAGFDEEEKRLRQRMLDEAHFSIKLPQGPYIFCDFQTLHIPGIELNPLPSEALKLMHKLAADPGIVAIMNKHRWRVGIMTELAPVGYVGISPKCLLGFNKNQGEEISLRLRTDDLKGFRKYESIKKTLLHELAHMIHSEHDAEFYALDKQLNHEVVALDWTRSRSHRMGGVKYQEHHGDETQIGNRLSSALRIGGNVLGHHHDARASSVAAAYRRLGNTSSEPQIHNGPNIHVHEEAQSRKEPDTVHTNLNQKLAELPNNFASPGDDQSMVEPDPDDNVGNGCMQRSTNEESGEEGMSTEPDPDDCKASSLRQKASEEPDPDDCTVSMKVEVSNRRDLAEVRQNIGPMNALSEPDPDDSAAVQSEMLDGDVTSHDQKNSFPSETVENLTQVACHGLPHVDDSQGDGVIGMEADPVILTRVNEPDPDDSQELQAIQDPVSLLYTRLQKAVEMLRIEVNDSEAASVLQTLVKIIWNIIEHPNEMKFKKLRKSNPIIQRNVVAYKAASEILSLVGFLEDVVFDEYRNTETYLVWKRNDPGLLWLAKSSIETYIAEQS